MRHDGGEEEAGASCTEAPTSAGTAAAQAHSSSTMRSSRGERARGRRWTGVKKGKVTPLPYLYRGAAVVGTVGVLHYPAHFCRGSPRGGATWGGGLNNRAIRRIMTVIATVINGLQ
jgi:hypothetical protein